MDRRAPQAIAFLAFLFAAIAIANALSFTASPEINSGNNATTTENLICQWDASGDTTQTNVTWYRNGISQLNVTSAISPSTLGSGNTTRGEVWNCSVTITNGTSVIVQSDILNIINANPDAISVRNESSLDQGNRTTILEDEARTFTVVSVDPDSDEVSYSSISLPSNANLGSSTGIMTWTPNVSQLGNNTVTFIALDNQTPDRGSSAKDFTFEVLAVNDNPTFSPALANQSATEGVAFTYNISGADEENDFPLNFTVSSDIGNLAINLTSNTTATIYFTTGSPSFSDRGNHTVSVNLTDANGASIVSTFNLEVSPVNQLPILSFISNASGTQGSIFITYFNATDFDVNDTLVFNINPVSCALSNPWSVDKIGQGPILTYTQANATINQTLTNTHVACKLVNISVSDGKETDTQVVEFNLTNVNDAPVLYDISGTASNSDGSNITSQTAYSNSVYKYTANASDVDSLVSGGENLTFTDNTSLFNINSVGYISFTPNSSHIGNHSILITVLDDDGLNDTKLMVLEVKNNSAPVLDAVANQTCLEDLQCTIYITATDTDGDNISFSSNNTAIFNITDYNTTAGRLQITYLQSQIGNYSITVTATDTRLASDSAVFNLTINNINDNPVLSPVVFPNPIVATHLVSFQATASDEDIQLYGGQEFLNFSSEFITNSTIFNISTSFNNATNTSTGIITFTPSAGDVGNHSVNISVRDPSNATHYRIVNFTILAKTNPPNITEIQPYGTPISNITVFSFYNTTGFPDMNTSINISENKTVLFNHTTLDDTTPSASLGIMWQLDGINITSNTSLNYYFDFFTSGTKRMKLLVEDDMLENNSFTWVIDITNINRPPILNTSLENVTIDSTETFTNYLYLRDELRYLDPDDDLNSNKLIGTGETNTLTFTATACAVATITITDQDVKFTPSDIGTCIVTFTAEDTGGLTLESNFVYVNVTEVPNGTETTIEVPVSTAGGGGGGGGSASIVIPEEIEVETPKPLNLIVPESISIFRNKSISVPIIVENTWNATIYDIVVSAFTNKTGINITLDRFQFPEMETDDKETIIMTVMGYRLGENFEIHMNASLPDPKFTDTASIFINSMEQTGEDESVAVKVTFARDLLSTNEECQELNELLNEADHQNKLGNVNEANRLLDTVINGCKYLASKTQVHEEKPTIFDLGFFKRFNFFYIGIGALLVAFVTAIVVIELRLRKEKNHPKTP
ncbi:putative Ig domain-containing protein [Nanoarchaeota archaeon]